MPSNRRKHFGAWISRPESIVGVCAVVVSVVAVAVSAYEARIQRQWQRAALWPYVQLSRSYYLAGPDGAQEWRLTLNAENVGVGPARVRDFRVTVDGKPQRTWGAAMQALLGTSGEFRYGQSAIVGTIVPPQKTVQMFQYSVQPEAERLHAAMDRLDFEACFCSVFDECWRTSFRKTAAQDVGHCATGADSFTE